MCAVPFLLACSNSELHKFCALLDSNLNSWKKVSIRASKKFSFGKWLVVLYKQQVEVYINYITWAIHLLTCLVARGQRQPHPCLFSCRTQKLAMPLNQILNYFLYFSLFVQFILIVVTNTLSVSSFFFDNVVGILAKGVIH